MITWMAAVPPEIAGVPTWFLNGLSVTTLVVFIVAGLATSRLWTKDQVDKLTERYEKHLERTVNNMQGRIDDAIRRENEWRELAGKWQTVAQTLSDAIGPMQQQSETILTIVREMQTLRNVPRPGRGGR